MTAEPAQEPGADQPAAPAPPPSSEVGPTFQTASSEAAEVAAQAVARQVALTLAENASASMAAASAAPASEAAEAAEVATPASTTEASPSTEAAAVDDAPAIDSAPADHAPSIAAAASSDVGDASVAATAPAPATEAAMLSSDPVAPAVSTPTPESAPAVAPRSRRPVILAWTRRLAVFVVSIALLAGGFVLGSTTFQRTRPAPTGGGAIEFSQPPPDVAREFIVALAADDSDAIRSSLSTETNKDLINEFTKFGIKKVNKVETLGTSVDGPRSATEVLLHTTDSDGNAFDINLIILVNGNTIEGFR